MPIYEFRCGSGHVHELALSMDSADREAACPECAAPATRFISAPGISHLGSERARMIDGAEASAHRPGVVDHVPGSGPAHRRPTPVSRDPRHARLPRP